MKENAFKSIIEAFTKGRKHEHYDHAKKYAEKLKELTISDDKAAKALLSQLTTRETNEELEQRKKLTKLICGSIINKIEVPFAKADRTEGITLSFQTEKETMDSYPELTDSFDGRKSISEYLFETVRRYRRIDPNAFLAIEWNSFDSNKEKPKVFPVIYKCSEVLDFKFDNEILEYLVVQRGGRYIAYFKGGSFLLQELESGGSILPEDYKYEDYEGLLSEGVKFSFNSKAFVITEFNNNSEGKLIQAERIGYIPDERTDGATCVTHWHPALSRIERTIIANSESDLTHALHVFAQKLIMTEPCKGYNDGSVHMNCSGGFAQGTNHTCKNCGGTGQQPMHKSSQDVIYVKLGKDSTDTPDIDKIVRYIRPDLETAKYLEEFLDKQSQECLRDVFAGNSFSTPSAEQTATFVQVNYESIYDAVTPYCKKTSHLFEFCAETRAWVEMDKKINVDHQYPKDLEIETMAELVSQYKNSEGAPSEVRRRIRERIIRRSLNNQPLASQRAIVKMMHEPFADKTESEKASIIASNLVPIEKKILYANYDDIMNYLIEQSSSFVQMTYAKRQELIDAEVNKIKLGLNPTMPLE